MTTRLRFATFNVAMSADRQGEIFSQLQRENTLRFQRIAAIIQHCQPDVLLLCEFDHPGEGGDDGMLDYFQRYFLEVSQFGQAPIFFPYRLLPPTNTGLPLFTDSNVATGPQEAQGFGYHHGQYGFVLLSKYPIDHAKLRSWQTLLWRDFHHSRMPTDFYSKAQQGVQRLSSKNHILVPITVEDTPISVIACHPTPPVFDGPERRNYRRNADEVRLLIDIIRNHPRLVDDDGRSGGINPDDHFVVMGDLNADPINGEGDKNTIATLLNLPVLQPVAASSKGARESLKSQRTLAKSKATHHRGLRLDYVLPSASLVLKEAGVFWPQKADPLSFLIDDLQQKTTSHHSSDHRLVWVDVAL